MDVHGILIVISRPCLWMEILLYISCIVLYIAGSCTSLFTPDLLIAKKRLYLICVGNFLEKSKENQKMAILENVYVRIRGLTVYSKCCFQTKWQVFSFKMSHHM